MNANSKKKRRRIKPFRVYIMVITHFFYFDNFQIEVVSTKRTCAASCIWTREKKLWCPKLRRNKNMMRRLKFYLDCIKTISIWFEYLIYMENWRCAVLAQATQNTLNSLSSIELLTVNEIFLIIYTKQHHN